ncbi:glycoside hydrolase family 5 protein [Lichenicoccus sp.]|uniref:glycoside hydrolase family 5 protein n=1 Tax=Lichenicoccus sp. TaxID=2781899 RepID=UPI003D10F495
MALKSARAACRSVWAAVGLLICMAQASAAVPPARLAVLDRGINIVHWFRFVSNQNARAMAAYMGEPALVDLKKAGFTYVRLAVGPEEVMSGNHIEADKLTALESAIARIEHAGLGVMVEAHPEKIENWDLQNNAMARQELFGFWHDLAPALKPFPAALTFPELVNEPSVKDPAQWDALQRQLLAQVRDALPKDTIILTGSDWSSIDGLLKVRPVADANVVYSFHSYEPQLLALLGFWDSAINKKQLAANLPFPASDPKQCKAAIAAITDPHTHAVAEYWCSLHPDDAMISRNLARATQWGHEHRVSVAMTEFGASSELNSPARLAYFSAVRRSAEKLGLPWALWGLDDQMGLGQSTGSQSAAIRLPPDTMRALGLR